MPRSYMTKYRVFLSMYGRISTSAFVRISHPCDETAFENYFQKTTYQKDTISKF